MLLLDNRTRWNSIYAMCRRAIRQDVQEALVRLMNAEPELRADYLLPEDFTNLASLVEFLKPFHDWTIETEAVKDSVDMVLPAYDTLLAHLEAARLRWQDDGFMSARIEANWSKLNSYYRLTDDTSAYFAATILNPTLKLAYFEQTWGHTPALAEHLESLKRRMLDKWRGEYWGTTSTTSVVPTRQASQYGRPSSIFAGIRESLQRPEMAEDEMELYLREPILGPKDVVNIDQFRALDWWCKKKQSLRYPLLHRYAIDLLSIPPQSSEIERVFSECKASLTQQRNRMEVRTLEQVQQLRSWLRCARRVEDQMIDELPVLATDEVDAEGLGFDEGRDDTTDVIFD